MCGKAQINFSGLSQGFGKRFNGRKRIVEMPTAVIRNDHGIGAQLSASLHVLAGHDAFGDDGKIRRPLDPLQVFPSGRGVRSPVAAVGGRLRGRTRHTLAVFGDASSEPLLGAYTLEAFGLAADPANRRLVPVPGLLKAAS